MKRVSLVIPVYKVEAYLRECVDSVLSQTYGELEIILVDDGSPDRCGAICDEYAHKDDRILVIHKENGGLSDARNAGLEIVTGEYVWFLDSDDYIVPEAVDHLLRQAEETESDIVFLDAVNFCEKGYVPDFNESLVHRFSYMPAPGPEMVIRMLAQDDYNCAAYTHFYKTEFLKSNGFTFVKGLLFEDLMFNGTVFLKARKVSGMKESLYMRRLHGGSIMTSSGSVKKVRSYRYIVERFLAKYREESTDDKEKKALSYLTALAANMCLIRYADVPRAAARDAAKEVKAVKEMLRPYDYFGNWKVKAKMRCISGFRAYRQAKNKLVKLSNSRRAEK